MDFLEGIGEFMQREGIEELEILDGNRCISLRRRPVDGTGKHPGENRQHTVAAPLSGILHLTPSQGEPPYSLPGQAKKRGELLFCIEALKHLHGVRAQFDLVVEEILVRDLEPVQEGQGIMRVLREDLDCKI